MHSRRPSADDPAARRLALIAAGAGGGRGAPTDLPGDEVDRPEDTTTAPWWEDHTRVVERVPPEPPPVVPVVPVVPVIPVPGRHAARRRASWGAARTVRERVPALAPVHVAVVALVVALGLAVTTWWVVRDDPAPAVAPVAAEPVEPLVPAPTASGGASPPAEEGGAVTVDVAGKVRRPGIVVLDEGARVTDAVEAAGGARQGVDLTSLNLARLLVDGEQVLVGARGAPSGAAGAAGPAGEAGAGLPGTPVNLNLATEAELEALPDVGPVTAQSIIDWREERGGFTSVDELLEVDGIGEKTLARLAPLVTV
ncbi:MAG TPA: helix-hairpin-helix domain-containing protein [Nocardioides sp.]|nr:helix-hairpin-helix domain-containing protein [Nocardioides sp.]